MKKTFRKGGIHPPAAKSASRLISLLPLPMRAVIPLQQHIGAAARPLVGRGDRVVRGQVLAEGTSAVSACLHSPVSGTVSAIEDVLMPWGTPTRAIIVSSGEAEHAADSEAREALWAKTLDAPADSAVARDIDADEIRRRTAAAGIVGLGGATFPAHVKLAPRSAVDTLIINGCECEPYLMCDDALMCAAPARVVEGTALMLKATGCTRAVIALEDNKPEAAEALASVLASGSFPGISVELMRTKYPQGGEKQLIEAVTGRRVPSGALPAAVGVVVHNVATAVAVRQAVVLGEPLLERVVTVSGDIPEAERRNWLAALGTPLAELPFTLPADRDVRIIAGGPMMGRTAVCLDAPVMKGTSGLTILAEARRRPVQPCVRCAACVQACPMGLEPYLLAAYGERRMWHEAAAADVADCLECGACSWSCPSSRPLLDHIRTARRRSRNLK